MANSEGGGGAIKIVIALLVLAVLGCGGCSLLGVLGVVAQGMYVRASIAEELTEP